MFFLNLSFGEFLALWGAVSGVVLALYLLERSRRKVRVGTLRFWTPAQKPPEARRRRHIQNPISLLLQLLAMALLLAAVAQLRFGSPESATRDHVLLLDTSAWMSARGPRGTLFDSARRSALQWMRALPAGDRVMLVRADALPSPVTVFESNRGAIEAAILIARPGDSALHLRPVFDFAKQMQRQHGRGSGEIVLASAMRVNAASIPESLPANLRLLPVDETIRDVGIRRVNLHRSGADPQVWEVEATIRNYGGRSEIAPVTISYGGSPVGTSRSNLAAGEEQTLRFPFRTKAAGWVDVRILAKDGLAADDAVRLEIPQQKQVIVAVYSRDPQGLRTLLSANTWVAAAYLPPEAYSPSVKADIVILDRFRPAVQPTRNTVWIEPPQGNSPVPIRKLAKGIKIGRWHVEHPLARGLRSLDAQLDSAELFEPSPTLEVVAEAEGLPIVAASTEGKRSVYLGFNPSSPALRFQLTAPLLMANILEWMAPEIFERAEVRAESAGLMSVPLPAATDAASLRVTADDGSAIPYSIVDRNLQFFGGGRGVVRVGDGSRQTVYSLTLPEIADSRWSPPASVKRGIAKAGPLTVTSRDVWQWLAIAGAALLLMEWFLFARQRIPAGALRPVTLFSKATAPFRKAS